MKKIQKIIFSSAILCLLFSASACKKKKDAHVPPDVAFKTGSGYTAGDVTVTTQDTLKVGIVATKTEDDLKSLNVSYAYDGSSTTTTQNTFYMTASEYEYYEKDVQIITRNVAGSERWVFSIVDRDGNITQKTIVLTVQ